MKAAVAAVFSAALCLPLAAQSPTPLKTILEGVFSDAQRVRGQASYTALCASCHGTDLEGVSAPELTGNRFVTRWREGTLDGIYSFIKQTMPRARPANAKPIPDSEYLDILTYILKANEYPAGSADLSPALLSSVLFVGKNGPQPVPDGALILTFGCLSQAANGTWTLISAAEPVRTRSEIATAEEVKSFSARNLGSLVFRLAELDAVPNFAPEAHRGHKMLAKGYLVRQPNAERISLSSMEMLASTCQK